MQPRQNLPDKALPAQNASVSEERILAGLRVVGHPPTRVFLIFGIRGSPAADELRPVFVVVALADCEIAKIPRATERSGINPELPANEVNYANVRRRG
jgi:hypothetical protein